MSEKIAAFSTLFFGIVHDPVRRSTDRTMVNLFAFERKKKNGKDRIFAGKPKPNVDPASQGDLYYRSFAKGVIKMF